MVDSNYSLYKDNSIQCRKMFIWDENMVKKNGGISELFL